MASCWQHNKELSESNEYMFNNEILSDVTFLAGPDKTHIKAHKYVLVSRSPVFYAMFCGQLAEASQSIEIPDVDAGTLKELLRYLYTGICPINGDNVLYLLYGAKKYDVPTLEQECKSFMDENLSGTNAFAILQHARTFDEKELAEKCMLLIIENASEALKSDGFKTVSKETVKHVIANDNLIVTDEIEVLEACKNWAAAQCKELDNDITPTSIRDILGDIIQQIRFPLMTAESFTKHVSKDQILSDKELIAMYQYFAVGGEITQFCAKERKSRIMTVDRFPGCNYIGRGWTHGGPEDALSVSLTGNALLIGLSVLLPISQGTISGQLKVLQGENTLVEKQVDLCYNGEKYKDIVFEKSIPLKRGIQYRLSQTFTGVMTYAGQNGAEIVEVDGTVVTFSNSERSQNGTNKTTGQFHRLLLENKMTY